MKFQIIVADPPWSLSDQLKMSSVKRGSAANYNVMTVKDISALPVADLADPKGCVLALWVLGSMLEEGMTVMTDWGFTQKQVFVWVKTKKRSSVTDLLIHNAINWFENFIPEQLLAFGMGRLFRQTHEICLIGINNTKIYRKLQDKSQRSVCFDVNQGHSIKPEALQDRLEIMFPGTQRLEMFSRRKREGWVNVGDEVSKEDILTSISKLKLLNEKGTATK